MKAIVRTFKSALHALRRNVMRSALTCLGIIIGIASVIAMAEIGQGSADAIKRTIASMGANQMGISPQASSVGGVSFGAATGVTLTPDDCEAINAECPAVRVAAPNVDGRGQIVYGNRNWQPSSFKGTTPAYLDVKNWADLTDGESFTDDDVRRAAPVCLIGETIRKELFDGASPIGKSIRIGNINLRIVGVLSQKGANMMGRDQDDVVIAPWTTVKYRMFGSKLNLQNVAQQSASSATAINSLSSLYPTKSVQLYPQASSVQSRATPVISRISDLDDIYLSAVSPEAIPAAREQITRILRDRHRLRENEPDDFEIRSMTEFAQAFGSTTLMMTNLLLCVALISLVVGGVGIMNIMLVSVTERTREIGLRMAVGARARDILRQFLIEAVLLCVAGGVVGILVGRGVSIALTAFLKWPTLPSLPALIAAVVVSVTVGVTFGFYPAWKASRMDPIEALRFE
jgi:ABC-type antimicrobial peptide transport system permease subunit